MPLVALLGLVILLPVNTLIASEDLSSQDIQALQSFAQQNPQVVSQLKSAMQSGQGAQGLDSKSTQAVQSFLTKSPQLAQKVKSIMQGESQPNDATQTSTTNQPAPTNTNVTSTQSQGAVSQTDTTAANTQDQDTTVVPPQPYQPWKATDQTEANARSAAFKDLANQAFPLSPEQIKQLNSMLDATQRAQAATPNDKPPMPTSTSLLVDLDPGATPPVIRLSRGFVSSLVFVDATGAAWPIESYDLGDPKSFNIQWNKKSNTLMIQAMSAYNYGNLAVKLQDMNTPIMLTLVPGQQQIDYRVDLRLPEKGPNAKASIEGSGLPGQADKKLLDILDGISPRGAKRLDIAGGIAQAWELNDSLYVRTRFTLISPAWLSKMSSADGMNAYKLQLTPLLLVSRYGKVMQLKVEGM